MLGRIAPPDIAHGTHRASRTRPSRRGPERSVLDRSPRSRRDVHDTEGVLGRRRAALGNAVPSERIDTGGTACPRLGRIRSRCTARPWPRIVATGQLALHAQAGLHARLGHSIRGEAWVRQTDDAGQRASGAGDSSIVLKRRFAIDEASAFGLEGGRRCPPDATASRTERHAIQSTASTAQTSAATIPTSIWWERALGPRTPG